MAPVETVLENSPSFTERLRDGWLGRNVVMPLIEGGRGDQIADHIASFIQTTHDSGSELKEALGQDLANIHNIPSRVERVQRYGALATGISAYAVNSTQARLVLTTMLQAEMARKSNLFDATLVLAPAHFSYFSIYANILGLGVRQAPEFTAVTGRLLGVNKEDQPNLLSRLARREPFSEEHNPFKRFLLKAKHRIGRGAATQIGGSTLLLVVASAAQGQSPGEQAKLGIEVAADNTIGSLGKGIVVAGTVASVGAFDPGFAHEILNFSRTPEGALASTATLMTAFLGLGKLVKRRRHTQEVVEPGTELSTGDYAAADNPLIVVHYG